MPLPAARNLPPVRVLSIIGYFDPVYFDPVYFDTTTVTTVTPKRILLPSR